MKRQWYSRQWYFLSNDGVEGTLGIIDASGMRPVASITALPPGHILDTMATIVKLLNQSESDNVRHAKECGRHEGANGPTDKP